MKLWMVNLLRTDDNQICAAECMFGVGAHFGTSVDDFEGLQISGYHSTTQNVSTDFRRLHRFLSGIFEGKPDEEWRGLGWLSFSERPL